MELAVDLERQTVGQDSSFELVVTLHPLVAPVSVRAVGMRRSLDLIMVWGFISALLASKRTVKVSLNARIRVLVLLRGGDMLVSRVAVTIDSTVALTAAHAW